MTPADDGNGCQTGADADRTIDQPRDFRSGRWAPATGSPWARRGNAVLIDNPDVVAAVLDGIASGKFHAQIAREIGISQSLSKKIGAKHGAVSSYNGSWLTEEEREGRRRARSSWSGMINRCTNPSVRSYKDYGARGIRVCDRWRDFRAFLADMGLPAKGMSIERIDNNGNYEPANCRWIPMAEQARNKRNNVWITYGNRTMLSSEWADELGLHRSTLHLRIRRHGKEVAVAMGRSTRRGRNGN